MRATKSQSYKPASPLTIRNRFRALPRVVLPPRALACLLLLFAALPVAQAQRGFSATHQVKPGETLAIIAQRYGVDMNALAALNSISNANVIRSWQTLAIPAFTSPPSSGQIHTVRRGETLGTIAKRYGVSLLDLQAVNQIWSSFIYPGQDLKLPAGASFAAAASPAPVSAPPVAVSAPPAQPAPVAQPQFHTVQRGETPFRIALRYGISVDELLRVNRIEDPRFIHAGNVLRVSSAAAPQPTAASAPAVAQSPAAAPEPAPAPPGDRRRYIVKRGDFLTQLGINLQTSWIALAKLNNLADPNNLHVGATLLIPKREDVELYDPEYAAWKWFDMIGNQPGPRVGSGREIVIVLGTQSAYAYENGVLQKAARISAGKKATPTIQGDHAIRLKRRSQTMSGAGYSLDNVEWVMYFYADYAIHGAWWHMNFGTPMSHGCVNMTNADAQWFYNFASLGTPVYVRL